MSLLVDTSVWALALRRDTPAGVPEVTARALGTGATVVTTGIILQEILQGFRGPRAPDRILARFSALPLLAPVLDDHIQAAGLRNRCRRSGVQIGTIDALLAQLCIHHALTLLTTDRDFTRVAANIDLDVWQP